MQPKNTAGRTWSASESFAHVDAASRLVDKKNDACVSNTLAVEDVPYCKDRHATDLTVNVFTVNT